MADSPDDPKRTPKYLPRIKYTPPEELKVEGEEDDEEEFDGAETSAEPPRKKVPRPATQGTPVEPPKPRAKPPVPPANPPRAGLIDRGVPANPPRSGAAEPRPKGRPRDEEHDARPAP